MASEAVAETPTEQPVDVILRDGTTIRLRPPREADIEHLVEFFQSLSMRSRFLRFHGLGASGQSFAATVVEPDFDTRGALIAVLGEPEAAERIVGVGNYVRLRDARVAEAAFAVADELQRRGLGTRLLEQLAERAGEHGIRRLVAEVLPENEAMLKAFEGFGFRLARRLEGGVYEVEFSIEPTDTYYAAVDERDHIAVVASLEPFFRPRSIAVMGASPRRGSLGGELFRNILAGGFTGVAYPLNRHGLPVGGVQAYEAIEDIQDEIDLAVLCLPAERTLDAAEHALRRGVKALCVISAGFAEVGNAGRERQDRLLALVRAHGARLLGPNCLGITSTSVGLNATFARHAFPAGHIGFSSQSGALGVALLERASARGLGLSAFVSIGNKADVSSNDLLEWWEDDPETEVVLLYLESFGNPRRFARLARRVARHKPVLAMKAGRTTSGRRAAGSHTAALASSDAAVDALFHQAGVLRADTLVELLDMATLLSAQPVPRGRRVAVLTNAGGLGTLCADACENEGLAVPLLSGRTRDALASLLPPEASTANPVDMIGSATADTYRQTIPLLLADPGIDSLIVLFVPPASVSVTEVGSAISETVADAADAGKPVLASVLASTGAPSTLRSCAPVPAFAYPEAAARALARAAERGDWLRRSAGRHQEPSGIDVEGARALVIQALSSEHESVWLDAQSTRKLLSLFGIPRVDERLARTVEEAVEAAEDMGLPAVVKTATAGAHKTETGGVALDLATRDAVAAATQRIGLPVIVQPFLPPGVELLAGIVQDPAFGPLVAFGPGGTHAELIGGADFRLAPLTDVDADELVHGGKAGVLVSGYRGRADVDADRLTDLVTRLGWLADAVPEVAELDLNPVIAYPDAVAVVDARARIAPPAPHDETKSW